MAARSIGQIIQALRKRSGMTQAELAEQIHEAPNTLSGYENDTTQPSLETIGRLADVFGVSTDVQLGRKPISSPCQPTLDLTGQMFLKRVDDLYREYHPEHINHKK